MEIWTKIFVIASLATLVMQTNWYERAGLDFKPFNCTLCLTTWLSLGYYLSVEGLWGIPYAAATGVIAELLDRQLNQF